MTYVVKHKAAKPPPIKNDAKLPTEVARLEFLRIFKTNFSQKLANFYEF